MPLLISLHGLPGSGKDTFANSLTEGCWSNMKFSTPIKLGLTAMFNIPLADMESPLIKNKENYRWNKSIRYLLQTLGTEFGRNLIQDDIWLELGREAIEHQFSHGMNVVNTDLRFPNEAKMVKELGGYIVHIIRDNNENAINSAASGLKNHPSDSGIPLELIDFTIYNNHSIEMFHDEVAKVIYQIVESQTSPPSR